MIPFGFLFVITAIESIGDIRPRPPSSTGQPITGPVYFQRLRGGVIADGVSSLLAAVFNSFPSTTFAQNNGVIQLTGVGSRRIGVFVGFILVAMGLFPAVGGVVQAMPEAVLGGATIIMFGTVAVSGNQNPIWGHHGPPRIYHRCNFLRAGFRRHLRSGDHASHAASAKSDLVLWHRNRRNVCAAVERAVARKEGLAGADSSGQEHPHACDHG